MTEFWDPVWADEPTPIEVDVPEGEPDGEPV